MCSSASDLATVASVSNSVSTSIRDSLSSGVFLSVLSSVLSISSAFNSDATIATCLVVWGNTEAKPETEIGSAGAGTGNFYPDWENDSRTCLEDGNEPQYMAQDPAMWLSDSIIECCLRFFPWDTNTCLNVGGSGLWYVDSTTDKCVTDCAEGDGATCGGLTNVFSDRFYSDPKSCCESELQWMFVEFCKAESFVSSCYAGTGLYYRGDSAGSDFCVRDCDPANGDKTCGGLVKDTRVVLHDTAEDCCSAEYSWIDTELCSARTTHHPALNIGQTNRASVIKTRLSTLLLCLRNPVAVRGSLFGRKWHDVAGLGSNSFYVQDEKCVQDCVGAAPCGGLAEKWNIKYKTEDECCAVIPWVARKKLCFGLKYGVIYVYSPEEIF
ncbi:hypothetical protein ACHAXN_006936 [Cyclotella atomus]